MLPFDIMIWRQNHNCKEYRGWSKAIYCEMFMLTVKYPKAYVMKWNEEFGLKLIAVKSVDREHLKTENTNSKCVILKVCNHIELITFFTVSTLFYLHFFSRFGILCSVSESEISMEYIKLLSLKWTQFSFFEIDLFLT